MYTHHKFCFNKEKENVFHAVFNTSFSILPTIIYFYLIKINCIDCSNEIFN